ncbi:MAG: NAD(+)/NADH kinase [Deltaproteobacteria bacterium]|nr:NAD(+)/NADH kinase [Deltaproteobacteria bacterium]
MAPWKRVGVVLRPGEGEMAPLLSRVLAILAENSLDVLVDPEAGGHAPEAESAPLEEVAGRSDLVIALGGDGTVLAVARAIGARDAPIVGVNLGRLGFLADVSPEDVDAALPAILSGDYAVHERSRLAVEAPDGTRHLVLNDVVFARGGEPGGMIELEARADSRLIARYRADGLIVSTPTGSTAYNLSASGPLLDAEVPAMVLTPICPHTLTQRPLVLPDSLRVDVQPVSGEEVRVRLDGGEGLLLRPGQSVGVTRSDHPVRFVTPSGRDPFETLRTKLGWGSR